MNKVKTISANVESSVITQINFTDSENEMEVVFTSGAHYVYYGVSLIDYLTFISSNDIGVFFNTYIKGRFEYKKLETTSEKENTEEKKTKSKEDNVDLLDMLAALFIIGMGL